MKEQTPNDNWRLQEDDLDDDKWILEESEQRVTDQWQLQSSQSPEEVTSWQPVEYVKPNRPAGAWILPTIITLALLLVIGYTAYRVLPSLLGTDEPPVVAEDPVPPAESTPPDEGVADAEVPVEAPTEAAPPTPEQETAPTPDTAPAGEGAAEEAAPTPAPPPSGQVVVEFAVVTPTFGLNARLAPDANAEIIRILDPNESVLVFGRQGEWLEIFVNETPLAEGEPLAGTVGYAAAEFMEITTREISEQLYNEILAFTGKQQPTPAPAADAADTPGEATELGETSETPLTVTVNAISGVNVRTEPNATTDESVVRLLENGTVVPAVARTADSTWVQVQLPDGATGWVAVEFLVPSGDITTLPTPDQAEAPAAGDTSAPITGTTVVTTGVAVDAPYSNVVPGDNVPAIIVDIPEGVNARTAPNLEAEIETLVPEGVVLPALGRSSDNQWVQVQLPTGVQAWIFRTTVQETPAVGALPAVLTQLPTPSAIEPGQQILIPTPTPAGAATEADTETEAEPETETETDDAASTVTADVLPFVLPVYPDPSSDGTPVLRAQRGTSFTVIGRNEAGTWLQVETADGTVGWVIAGNVNVTGDPASLPVAE